MGGVVGGCVICEDFLPYGGAEELLEWWSGCSGMGVHVLIEPLDVCIGRGAWPGPVKEMKVYSK